MEYRDRQGCSVCVWGQVMWVFICCYPGASEKILDGSKKAVAPHNVGYTMWDGQLGSNVLSMENALEVHMKLEMKNRTFIYPKCSMGICLSREQH